MKRGNISSDEDDISSEIENAHLVQLAKSKKVHVSEDPHNIIEREMVNIKEK